MSASMTTEELRGVVPFAAELGVIVDEASAGEVVARLPWQPRLCTAGGVLHGGALMALADTAGAVCAHLGLPEGASTATVSSTTHFFRASRGGDVVAIARPVHRGRTSVVVRTTLTDENGRLVADVVQAQAILQAVTS